MPMIVARVGTNGNASSVFIKIFLEKLHSFSHMVFDNFIQPVVP